MLFKKEKRKTTAAKAQQFAKLPIDVGDVMSHTRFDISFGVFVIECRVATKTSSSKLNYNFKIMPLPPALLKRLAKRGLVEKGAKRPQNDVKTSQAPAEEIIAEDYDDVDEVQQKAEYEYDYQTHSKKTPQNFWSERLKKRIVDGSVNGYKGCANKYNIYHKCSLFCVNKFGDGIKEPSKSYQKRKTRLLRRHPLSKDWKEVYDEGVYVFKIYFVSLFFF